MINRTLVRTRVMQTLFAYYKDGEKTPLTAQKELVRSFADTYDLYMTLLDFAPVLTAYADQQIADAEQRAKATHTPYRANRRFVENRLADQLFHNRPLRNYAEEQKISWDNGLNAVMAIYKQLQDSEVYREYMAADSCSYDDDKRIWRHIYADIMPESEALRDALEELELSHDHANWTTDLEVVLTFVVKTIKRFHADSCCDTALLPMFDTDDELHFATDLLRHAIQGHDRYEELINTHLSKKWEADRVAYMDRIILHVALAEILHFDDIALTISLNEYIELGREYSSDKSHAFINGILNEILHDMKRDGTLPKALTLK